MKNISRILCFGIKQLLASGHGSHGMCLEKSSGVPPETRECLKCFLGFSAAPALMDLGFGAGGCGIFSLGASSRENKILDELSSECSFPIPSLSRLSLALKRGINDVLMSEEPH